jgi:hypothetical protein
MRGLELETHAIAVAGASELHYRRPPRYGSGRQSKRGDFWPTSLPFFQAAHFSMASITGSLAADWRPYSWAEIGTAASVGMLEEY